MDSFTQVLLGAVVAESVAGKQLGRRASAWGAALGILPDLDYFVRYSNPVDSFTYHRSFSHSLLILAILTPLLLWLAGKIHRGDELSRQRGAWMILLCLATHSLLDCLTVYGTQVFWPLSEYPVGLGSVFIIDPLYSLPLLIGCVAVLISRGRVARRILNVGLVVATLYLAWGVLVQQLVTQRLERQLPAMAIEARQVVVTPAPFTSLLWRFVLRVEDGYHEGFISLLDEDAPPLTRFYPSEDRWITALQELPSAARLMWFSKGMFAVRRDQDAIFIEDLRMGIAPEYAFSYKVADVKGSELLETLPQRHNNRSATRQKLEWLLQRIGDPKLALPVGNFGGRPE